MSKPLTSLTSLAVLAALSPSVAHAAPPSAPFDGALDARVAHDQSGNYVVSPASIELGLEMTREGARGATARELDGALGADTGAAVKALWAAWGTPQTAADMTQLSIANKLFGEQTAHFLPAFLDATQQGYGARLEAVDFAHAADAARRHINDWVAQATHDKIKDLLPPRAVDDATRLVLVDAIYLKAHWAKEFEAGETAPAPFKVSGAGTKQVATMHGELYADWGAHAGARVLDLSYRGGLAMLVVVPDSASLAAVESAYQREGFAPFMNAAVASKSHGGIIVALPKFEVATKIELSPALAAMGVKTAFTGAADFSGMSSDPVKLSSVIHQAWIKVDEAGTEAAAATAVEMAAGAAPPVSTPPHFDVDRSFLFFVHDTHGNVLFGGRVIDPSAPASK